MQEIHADCNNTHERKAPKINKLAVSWRKKEQQQKKKHLEVKTPQFY